MADKEKIDSNSIITMDKLELADKIKNDLPKNTIVKMPDDALINVSISGVFRSELGMLQEYLFDKIPDSDQELIKILALINTSQEDINKAIKEHDLVLDDKYYALKTIIILNMELNYRAIEQGAAAVYDKADVYESLADELKGGVLPLSDEEISKRKADEIKSNED